MHKKGYYKNLTEDKVKERIKAEGFTPVKITNSSGYVYNPHAHKETKLLAFLEGKMLLRIVDDFIECLPGDRVLIPSNVVHAAEVAKGGCVFFWAEKLENRKTD